MIRVMTFNIRYGQADDGPQRWEMRRDLVIERIRAADPDLLGLQECRDDEQAEFVRAALPDYDLYGGPRGGDGPTALEMAPVLVRRAAFEVVRQGQFKRGVRPKRCESRLRFAGRLFLV
jgi:endonuclease/exonuclease/phosphatase family metal-dependent hydrolase